MDRDRYSAIAHGGMRIWNPITREALLGLTERCRLNAASRVLDIGCGRAELLLTLIERHHCTAVGVDPSPRATALALAEADQRDPDGLLHLRVATFEAELFAPSSFDLVLCLGASHALGDGAQALAAMSALCRPGGHVLLGEGYWRAQPDPGYLALLGCREEELGTLPSFAAVGAELGLELQAQVTASEADWRRYEGDYAANMAAFLDAHPDDPEAEAFRARMESWQEGVSRWGRHCLGFAASLFSRG